MIRVNAKELHKAYQRLRDQPTQGRDPRDHWGCTSDKCLYIERDFGDVHLVSNGRGFTVTSRVLLGSKWTGEDAAYEAGFVPLKVLQTCNVAGDKEVTLRWEPKIQTVDLGADLKPVSHPYDNCHVSCGGLTGITKVPTGALGQSGLPREEEMPLVARSFEVDELRAAILNVIPPASSEEDGTSFNDLRWSDDPIGAATELATSCGRMASFVKVGGEAQVESGAKYAAFLKWRSIRSLGRWLARDGNTSDTEKAIVQYYGKSHPIIISRPSGRFIAQQSETPQFDPANFRRALRPGWTRLFWANGGSLERLAQVAMVTHHEGSACVLRLQDDGKMFARGHNQIGSFQASTEVEPVVEHGPSVFACAFSPPLFLALTRGITGFPVTLSYDGRMLVLQSTSQSIVRAMCVSVWDDEIERNFAKSGLTLEEAATS
jgi:hypothetical protein